MTKTQPYESERIVTSDHRMLVQCRNCKRIAWLLCSAADLHYSPVRWRCSCRMHNVEKEVASDAHV